MNRPATGTRENDVIAETRATYGIDTQHARNLVSRAIMQVLNGSDAAQLSQPSYPDGSLTPGCVETIRWLVNLDLNTPIKVPGRWQAILITADPEKLGWVLRKERLAGPSLLASTAPNLDLARTKAAWLNSQADPARDSPSPYPQTLALPTRWQLRDALREQLDDTCNRYGLSPSDVMELALVHWMNQQRGLRRPSPAVPLDELVADIESTYGLDQELAVEALHDGLQLAAWQTCRPVGALYAFTTRLTAAGADAVLHAIDLALHRRGRRYITGTTGTFAHVTANPEPGVWRVAVFQEQAGAHPTPLEGATTRSLREAMEHASSLLRMADARNREAIAAGATDPRADQRPVPPSASCPTVVP